MKRTFFLRGLLASLLLTSLPASSFADDISADNTYDVTLSQSGQLLDLITVANVNSVYSLKVTGDINGTDVAAIRKMTNLQILDLSDANVVSGGGAYYNDYTTSDNVVGSYFFKGLSNLKIVKLPNSAISVGSYVFDNCASLTSVSIGDNVETIGNYAFYGCAGLPEIKLPSGVTSIGYDAFKNCCNAITEELTIPAGITSIGTNAFENCGIKKLTIEDGTETLSFTTKSFTTDSDSYPFSNCPIETVYLGRNIAYNYVCYSGASPQIYSPFKNMTTITSMTIGSGVTRIEYKEFDGCTGLQTLTIEDSEQTLSIISCLRATFNVSQTAWTNRWDFKYPIEKFYVGRNLSYDSRKFQQNDLSSSGSLNPSGTVISNNQTTPFAAITAETSLTIGGNVTSVNALGFNGCAFVKKVTIGGNIETIDASAFKGCTGMTEATIGDGVETIEASAFSGCTGLSDLIR